MTPTRSTSAPARTTPKSPHVPGEAGVWIFILGDMTVFAYLFANYLHSRATNTAMFRAAQEQLDQSIGALNTVLLLASSLMVVLGVRLVQRDNPTNALRAFAVAALCGIGFGINKILEYRDHLAHGLSPHTNDFWMYYYILTGTHLFHLTVGLVVLGALMTLCRRHSAMPPRTGLIESGASFWHMVDLLWIVLFALFYLI